jgi:hypothetical protein
MFANFKELEKIKGTIFIAHIEKHLKQRDIQPQTVICMICGKTVEEIYEENRKEIEKKEAEP